MAVIPLSGTRREKLGKGGARKARAAGHIPGVLYGHGEEPVPVSVQAREFDLALRGHQGGNPIVNLAVNGGEYTALIRDVQYDPLTPRHRRAKERGQIDPLVHAFFVVRAPGQQGQLLRGRGLAAAGIALQHQRDAGIVK